MTWGSNATFQPSKCRYCGAPDIDDRDEGHSTHELACPARHWWVRLSRWWRRQDEPLVHAGCQSPNCACDMQPGSCRARYLSSHFAMKCKRLRTDGPTPCLCCNGDCHG